MFGNDDDDRERSHSRGRHTTLTSNIFDASSELDVVDVVPGHGDPSKEPLMVQFQESELTVRTGEKIGEGAFGAVYAATTSNGRSCAIKVNRRPMNDAEWGRLQEEVTLLRHFTRHPNTVRFFAAGRHGDRAYVVMELCISKSLNDVVSRRRLHLDEILWVGYQLVTTVAYLNKKGCVHRDLKPANLLFDEDGKLKITDFGLASRVSDDRPRKTVAGTMMYMAPELANHAFQRKIAHKRADGRAASHVDELHYGCEIDAWSVGMVLFVMATAENPYFKGGQRPASQEDFLRAVCQVRWSWPAGWEGDDELTEFVKWILSADRTKRPSIFEIANHEIWDRRPLTCPLSLLQALDIMPRHSAVPPPSFSAQSGIVSLSSLTNRASSSSSIAQERASSTVARDQSARAQINRYLADSLVALEQEEAAQRNIFYQRVGGILSVLKGRVQLMISECMDRQDVEELELVRRDKLLEAKLAAFPPLLVAGGHRRPSTTGRVVSRENSVMMIEPSSSRAAPLPPRGPPPSAPKQSRGASLALPLSTPVRQAPSVRDSSLATIVGVLCMNKHKMERLSKMPAGGYTGFDCNVCDQAVLKFSDKHYVYRCAKCDYDVCNKCADAKRYKDVHFLCATCGKKFPTHAKMQSHKRACRGPSVASPYSSPTEEGSTGGGVGEFSVMLSNVWEATPERSSSARKQPSSHRPSSRDVASFDLTKTDLSPSSPSSHTTTGMRAPPPTSTPLASYHALSQRNVSDDEESQYMVATREPHQRGGLPQFFTDTQSILADSVRLSQNNRSSSRASSLRRPPQPDPLLELNNDTEEMIPSSVGRLSKRLREEAAKGQAKTIRQSVEISPPKRRSRREDARLHQEANFQFKEEMLEEPVGIAAQRQQSRAREASLSPTFVRPTEAPQLPSRLSSSPTEPGTSRGNGNIVIRAVPSDQLEDGRRQPNVERKVFSLPRQGTTPPAEASPRAPAPVPTHGPAARRPASTPTATVAGPAASPSTAGQRQYVSNARVDAQGRIVTSSPLSAPSTGSDPMMFGGPAGGGAGAPPILQGLRGHTASVRQGSLSRMPMLTEVVVPIHNRAPTAISGGVDITAQMLPAGGGRPGTSPLPRVGGGGAFLALPKQTTDRAMFVEQILSGPWVRCYTFGFDETCVVHYSLQPGRFGGSFIGADNNFGTLVVDVHSKVVLYVPATNVDNSSRTQPHPHVQTFFNENVQLMSMHDAEVALPAIVRSVRTFANNCIQHQREGLVPNVVHAAFVHQHEATSVPRDTKFAYVRRVFPDAQRTTVIFRLSNLRAQVVSPIANVDIRWQSDRYQNIGTKYYVYGDGRTEPFVEDRTGILQHIQATLENSYRK